MMDASALERFEAKFIPEPMTGCWLWIGSGNGVEGYGQFWLNGRGQYAHRVSYEHHIGPISAGLVVDHLCHTRSCVNPVHLRAVTTRENTLARGSLATSKVHSEKTECPLGHPLAGRNLRPSDVPRRKRSCRACDNARGLLRGRGQSDADLKQLADKYFAKYASAPLSGEALRAVEEADDAAGDLP